MVKILLVWSGETIRDRTVGMDDAVSDSEYEVLRSVAYSKSQVSNESSVFLGVCWKERR